MSTEQAVELMSSEALAKAMVDDGGLVYAMLLDGEGSARHLTPEQALAWTPDHDGLLWLHMDYSAASTREWVSHHSGLDVITAGVLLSDETRPRITTHNNQALISAESKMSGRYSFGQRRMPGMEAPSFGCTPTICTSGFLLFKNADTPMMVPVVPIALTKWVT